MHPLAHGKKQQFKAAEIKERMHVPSAMPPGLPDVLGKRNLRDLIEFLASATAKPKAAAAAPAAAGSGTPP